MAMYLLIGGMVMILIRSYHVVWVLISLEVIGLAILVGISVNVLGGVVMYILGILVIESVLLMACFLGELGEWAENLVLD